MTERFAVVLLAKNEEASIGGVLTDLHQRFAGPKPHVLVVDDSTDRTAEIAASNGAEVIKGDNAGLGRAYYKGLKAAALKDVDFILTLDADGQTDFSEISVFLEALKFQAADLVVGSRFLSPNLVHYRYPRLNRFGIYLLSTYLTFVNGQRFTDSHGGIRIMRRKVAQDMEVWGSYTYVQETIVDAIARGYAVAEIASRWLPRRHGQSRVLHSIRRYIRKTSPILLRRAVWSLYFRTRRHLGL